MATMKKLLGENMNDNVHSTLGKSKYSWDQAQYAELQKHHLDKAQHHHSMAKMHAVANVQNLNAVPKVPDSIFKQNNIHNAHHTKLADAHMAAALALGDIAKHHIDTPPMIGLRT